MTPEERNLFALAERLHMPVFKLRDMPYSEYLGWIEFLSEPQDNGKNLLNNPDALVAAMEHSVAEGSFSLVGGKELADLLKEMPAKVQARATKTGLRKAANKTRTILRRAAPKQSGKLRQSILVKLGRKGKAWIGLRDRFYYKTLELHSARGGPLHPFFLAAWQAHEQEVAQLIVDETRKALYTEAGKVYARANFRK